jgi:UDPglucose 6-dehydrogenase
MGTIRTKQAEDWVKMSPGQHRLPLGFAGAGYVGLVTAVGFARLGHQVFLSDINKERIDSINNGTCPFFEKGMKDLLPHLMAEEKLRATCDTAEMVSRSKLIFICVSTYGVGDGHINLTAVREAAAIIGSLLKGRHDYPVVVVKSTVVPGTTEELIVPILEEKCRGKIGKAFGVAVVPEFLSEGRALQDFLEPSRIVIGTADEKTRFILADLFEAFRCPVLQVDFKTAEMIKYASNAALATRISFINEIGNICKLLGIDAYQVAKGVGLDPRIGPLFLQAGVGFGGSCLPKDVRALIARARDLGYEPGVLASVLKINQEQAARLVDIAESRLGSLEGKKVAVLGLAFKPGTDDVREAPALAAIEELIKRGALVMAYDPAAKLNARQAADAKVMFAESAREAIQGAEAVFIMTDWPEFKESALYKGKKVFDGRRVLQPGVQYDFNYEGIAW